MGLFYLNVDHRNVKSFNVKWHSRETIIVFVNLLLLFLVNNMGSILARLLSVQELCWKPRQCPRCVDFETCSITEFRGGSRYPGHFACGGHICKLFPGGVKTHPKTPTEPWTKSGTKSVQSREFKDIISFARGSRKQTRQCMFLSQRILKA